MKKYKISLAVLAMACACSGNVSAQNDLRGLLGGLIENSMKADDGDAQKQDDNNKKKGFLEGLSNIFSSLKTADADDLVGTWKYSEPAVMFDSDDAVQKIGGKFAADRIETRIQGIIKKYGLDRDPMTLQFNEDGSFVQTYKKFDLRGTYTVENKEVILKYSGRYKQIVGRTQLDGSSLVIVMDLDKINQFVVGIASQSQDPRAQLHSRLLGNVKGVSCGIRFEKQ